MKIYPFGRLLAALVSFFLIETNAMLQVQATPPAPALLAPAKNATLVNSGMIRFTWKAVPKAKSYEIRFRTEQSPAGVIDAIYRTTTPEFSIQLYSNCIWDWSVRAHDGRAWGGRTQRRFYTWDGVSCHPTHDCGDAGSGSGSGSGTGPGKNPNPPPVNHPPVVSTISGPQLVEAVGLAVATYSVRVTDDGLPKAPGRLSITWNRRQLTYWELGREITISAPTWRTVGAGSAASISFEGSGLYEVQATASDGEKSASAVVRIRAIVHSSISVPGK